MDNEIDLTRTSAITSSSWSDAIDRLGVGGVCSGLTLRSGHGPMAGVALTIKERSGAKGSYKEDDFTIAAVLDAAYPGCILVFDNGGSAVSTFGGLAARAAVQRGVKGLVIDGGCRDVEEIRMTGLWTATRHVTPMSARTRVAIDAIDVPVTICGTAIYPGDYLFGDETGIVCVPRARVKEAFEIAEMLTEQDSRFLAALNKGDTFGAAARRLKHL